MPDTVRKKNKWGGGFKTIFQSTMYELTPEGKEIIENFLRSLPELQSVCLTEKVAEYYRNVDNFLKVG